jgi:hypothetical protein
MSAKPDATDRLITRVLRATRPSRWLAFVIYTGGGVAVGMNIATVWSEAWLHRQPNVLAGVIGVVGALVCNAMGARLYYLAKDYPEYVAIRDRAVKVQGEVEAFLKDVGESRARGGEIVGVIIREFGETRAIYDDEPRVIN